MSSYIYIILTFIPVLVGAITFDKFKHTFLKYFLVYLVYCLFTEIAGYYVGFILRTRTYFIYNIYILVSVIFYFTLFNFYLKKNNLLLKILFFSYLIFYICNFLFIQKGILISQTYSFLAGSLFICIGIVILFFELLKSDFILNIKESLLFWICMGALLFFIGLVPIDVMAEFFNYAGMFDYITLGLNIIMCFCFSFGFLISKKEHNF